MCGRKTLTRDIQSIIDEMEIEEWKDSDIYQPRYNIAPTQYSPVIVDKMGRHAKLMKWGLIPNWSTDASIGSKLINARSETLLEKPSFQHLVPSRRCIVITDGYFEWKKTSSRSIPYYIHHPENKLLPMAGLWDIWKNSSGENQPYTFDTSDAEILCAFKPMIATNSETYTVKPGLFDQLEKHPEFRSKTNNQAQFVEDEQKIDVIRTKFSELSDSI